MSINHIGPAPPPSGSSAELACFVRSTSLRIAFATSLGHTAADLSSTDILAVLYARVLNCNAERPTDPERDRFVLSKSHASAAMYSILAAKGFLDIDELATYGQAGSRLCTVVSTRTPGIEFSTGSLGHGLSLGVGAAIGARLDGSARRTVVLTGDGELQEGSNWEAAMFAASRGLDNLLVIVDRNHAQKGSRTEDVNALDPLVDKWQSFGWSAVEVDGHDHDALEAVCSGALEAGRPTCVVAETTKGRGVSFMEERLEWHSKRMTEAQLERALRDVAEAAT